ncbi:MAG: MFS transporter [Dehalococcoidia bacterium]
MDLVALLTGRRKVFYGWYIVAACTTLTSFLATVFFSYSIFFAALRETFGWSSASTAAAFSFQRAQGGIAQPIVGFLVDRIGSRRMIFTGITIVGLGFVLFSRIDELWQFYLVILVISLGMSIGFGSPFNAALINWFRRHRSRALGLVWSGTPISGLLVPLVALMVIKLGWRDAALISGIAIWCVGLPLSLVVRHRPEPYGYLPDGDLPSNAGAAGSRPATPSPATTPATGLSVRQAVRTRSYWILSLGIGVEGAGTSALLLHLVAHLKNSGLSTAAAAAVLTAVALSYFLGRLPFAAIGDRLDKRSLLIGIFAIQAVGLAAFAFADHIWTIGIFVATVGIGHGAIVPLRPAAIADYMGTRSFASIAGVFDLPAVAGGIAGPVAMGLVFDWRGDYQLGILAFAGLLALMTPLFLLLRPAEFRAGAHP